MKKEKSLPVSKEIKSSKGSNPVNKFKKGSKGASLASMNNIITSAVESAKATTGSSLADEGPSVDYDEK